MLCLSLRQLSCVFALGLYLLLQPQTVSAELCRSVLADKEGIAPARVEFFENGKKRILEDSGLIYEFDGANWNRVGSGQLLNGVVYQKIDLVGQVSIGSKSQLLDLHLAMAGTKAPFRKPPIVKLVEFPSNAGSFSSSVHSLHIGEKVIDLVIPSNKGLDRVLEGLTQAVLNLPFRHLELVKTIRVNPYENRYFQERVFGSTTDNHPMIDLFPLSFDHFSNNLPFGVRLLRHEFGHLIATKIFGRSTPNKDYISEAQRDGIGVSEYGNTNWAEDFAETIETYLRLNAGNLDSHVRHQLRNRFEFLDRVFGQRAPGSVNWSNPTITKLRNGSHIFIAGLDSHTILVLVPEAGRGLILNLL